MSISMIKDPSGAPAVDLSKLRDGHPSLVKRAEKAGLALSKRGLDGARADVVLILDHSGSMRPDYKSGDVQTLVERALGFALQLDEDGKIPVIPFDNKLHLQGTLRKKPFMVDVSNYRDAVNKHLWNNSSMSSTVMSAPLEYIEEMAGKTHNPMFVIFVGDGSPDRDDRRRTTAAAMALSKLAVFVKFLALRPVEYLEDLDDLAIGDGHPVDNIDAKPDRDGKPILQMSDLEFADAMVDEWPTWIAAATAAGILS